MPTSWTPDQLSAIGAAHELKITGSRRDGTFREWMPI
jgi:hypothetical protein